MKNFFQKLENIYRYRIILLHRFNQERSSQNIDDALQDLSKYNEQILNLVQHEDFDRLLHQCIRNPNSQKFLADIFWGKKQPAENEETGIIPLIALQNKYLLELSEFKTGDTTTEKRKQNLSILFELINKDIRLFNLFKKDFQALYQERLKLSVIGFGEISTVLKFSGGTTFSDMQPEREKWVYKKMPIFPDMEEVNKFSAIFKEYHRLFTGEIGISIPDQRIQVHPVAGGKIRLYVLQKKCNAQAIGNKLIQLFDVSECSILLEMILKELKKVWTFNRSQHNVKVAIDGQISNWVLDSFNPAKEQFTGEEKLIYIDTSSPLYRIDGQEQLNPELFLKSTPFFLRPIIRSLFLQEVLDRYYDLHLVTVDLIANFFKEGKAVFIPAMIETANKFFDTQMSDFNIEPITEKEVTKYYKNDAFIWRFYLAARKIDRFITEKILMKKYEFRLPEKVER